MTVSITQPEHDRRRADRRHRRPGRLPLHAAPGGVFVVKFELPGFNTLNIEGVNVSAGATMTINGKLEVATLQETVTVTSQAPTIDLESSKVAVNWDQAEAGRYSVQPQPDRPGRAHSRPVRDVARRRRIELRHRLGPGGQDVRPHRRRRRQLRRHDLGPDLRRLRHLRGSADHDGRQGRRRDEPRRHDEPRRQVGQQHVQGRGLGELPDPATSRARTSPTNCWREAIAPGVNKFTTLQGLLR